MHLAVELLDGQEERGLSVLLASAEIEPLPEPAMRRIMRRQRFPLPSDQGRGAGTAFGEDVMRVQSTMPRRSCIDPFP